MCAGEVPADNQDFLVSDNGKHRTLPRGNMTFSNILTAVLNLKVANMAEKDVFCMSGVR